MKLTKNLNPPSKTKVKCKSCKQVIFNRDYFRKNHFPQQHKKLAKDGLDANDWWEYVKVPTKPMPNLSKNPFTVANRNLASNIPEPKPLNFFSITPTITTAQNLLPRKGITQIKEEKLSQTDLPEIEDMKGEYNKENRKDNQFPRSHEVEDQSLQKFSTIAREANAKDEQRLYILELKGKLEMLRRENEKLELESKQRNDENNKYKMIRTLELIHGKYQDTLTDL